ncbi:hypothetical protein ACFLR7_00360 [Acidobacteriota bacterium]
MTKYLLLFLIPAGISLLITPIFVIFARKAKLFDFPSVRKIHKEPIPILGGIPIFLSFNLGLLIYSKFDIEFLNELLNINWLILLFSQTIILLFGIYDDLSKLPPRIKFLFQILVGLVLVWSGFSIQTIANPFTENVIQFGIFSIPITVLWVVGITNALNLIDGLDGLATGTALIVCITIFLTSYSNQNYGVAIVSIVLCGSLLGFLKYNFFPAKIFLGDSGSLLLGSLLSILAIRGFSKGAAIATVIAPIIALGLPIMDTLLSMIRRFLNSMHIIDYSKEKGRYKVAFTKNSSIFAADRDHVHHRLLKLGYSHRASVLILYSICVVLGVLGFFSIALNNSKIITLLGVIIFAFLIGIKNLKYQEFKILKNGLLLPLFNYPIMNKRIFQVFFDLFVMTLSFFLSFVLISKRLSHDELQLFLHVLPFVLLIKMTIFYIFGIYKNAWTHSSLEDIIVVVKSVLLASIGTIVLFTTIYNLRLLGGIVFVVIDFYLLLTFVVTSRVSYRIVKSYYSRKADDVGTKVIIYGAGHRGSTVLKELRNNGDYIFMPVGFIDDDPAKIGRFVHNCPILGSIEDVEAVTIDSGISEIIVSTEKIKKEKIDRLQEFCKFKGIILRQYEFRFYEFS